MRCHYLLALAIGATQCVINSVYAATDVPPWQAQWLSIELNGVTQPDTLVLLTPDGRLWVEPRNIDAWRLARNPELAAHEFYGRAYYALGELAPADQLQWRIDEARQVLIITAKAQALQATQVNGASPNVRPNVAQQVGAFLNYDLAAQAVGSERVENALLDLNVFHGPMVFSHSQAMIHSGTATESLRLATSVTTDFPRRLATLTIGDAVSNAAAAGSAARFVGLQWATNFATQPDLLTLPLPSLNGAVTVPSMVDVFVNNTLVASRSVPAGPFQIDQLPTISGRGEVTARVRDVFGREHWLTQRLYSTPQLLRRGLNAYSFELGKLREDYATRADRYTQNFAQAVWRRGITNRFTGEVQGQWAGQHQQAGLATDYQLGYYGVVQASGALTHTRHGTGMQAAFGYDYSARHFSTGFSTRWRDALFQSLGDADIRPTARATRKQLDFAAHVGWSSPRLGSIGVALVSTDTPYAARIVTGSYSRNLSRVAFVSLAVSSNLKQHDATDMVLSITSFLGHSRSVSATVVNNQRGTGIAAELQQNHDMAPGLAYRAQLLQEKDTSAAGDLQWQGHAGRIGMELQRRDRINGARLYANGSLGLLDGHLLLLRHVDNNFALVIAPGLAHLPVYLENQIAAYTNDDGRATLSGLRPYQRNRISIDPVDVPLDVDIPRIQYEAVPYGRGGVVIELPVTSSKAVQLQLLQEDGLPMPAGMHAIINGTSYPIGLEGLLYLADAVEKKPITVMTKAGRCTAILAAGASKPLPQTVPVTCSLVAGP